MAVNRIKWTLALVVVLVMAAVIAKAQTPQLTASIVLLNDSSPMAWATKTRGLFVFINDPGTGADRYQVTGSYKDSAGSSHDVSQVVSRQGTNSVCFIEGDAQSASVTVTPLAPTAAAVEATNAHV